ncbi:MAG TPA: hypothetical protein PK177_00030 [Burkholderiaceae bacterium]|nr:hypothetical protein [Burkholderiaceae bacterium]
MRKASFDELQAIQKSTSDPRIDLSNLCEACMRIALDHGPEAIVNYGAAILALQGGEGRDVSAARNIARIGLDALAEGASA